MTLSASAGSVAEGGTITYTASVNNPVTGSDPIVTLTGGVTITIPVGSSQQRGESHQATFGRQARIATRSAL
ncbi:MAG: hypothetical protein IPO38_08520 [Rhodocyclaceae bacterium]|nr:hypothetical protein [Rhodocyclaceae bacterium]